MAAGVGVDKGAVLDALALSVRLWVVLWGTTSSPTVPPSLSHCLSTSSTLSLSFSPTEARVRGTEGGGGRGAQEPR
jgi:hypothetical protein